MGMVVSLRRYICTLRFGFKFIIPSISSVVILLCLTICLYRQWRYLSFPRLRSSIRHNLIVSFPQIRFIIANLRAHPALVYDHLLQLLLLKLLFVFIEFLFE